MRVQDSKRGPGANPAQVTAQEKETRRKSLFFLTSELSFQSQNLMKCDSILQNKSLKDKLT